jgi:hypothetical protein
MIKSDSLKNSNLPDGVLLSVGPDGPSVVGQVDSGIVGLSQSPDEELFLVQIKPISILDKFIFFPKLQP